VWNRADDVQAGPRGAREGDLSFAQIRRDVRSVDRGRLDFPAPLGESVAEVDAAYEDGAPRQLDFCKPNR